MVKAEESQGSCFFLSWVTYGFKSNQAPRERFANIYPHVCAPREFLCGLSFKLEMETRVPRTQAEAWKILGKGLKVGLVP